MRINHSTYSRDSRCNYYRSVQAVLDAMDDAADSIEIDIYCISCKKSYQYESAVYCPKEAARIEANYRYCAVCYAYASAYKTETFSLLDIMSRSDNAPTGYRKPVGDEFDSLESDSDVEQGNREDAYIAQLPTARRSTRRIRTIEK